jgi:hypothetical protein
MDYQGKKGASCHHINGVSCRKGIKKGVWFSQNSSENKRTQIDGTSLGVRYYAYFVQGEKIIRRKNRAL